METRKPQIIIPPPEIIAERQRAHDQMASFQHGRELHYDRSNRAFRIILRSGVNVTIPVAAITELASATPAQLAAVHLALGGGALELRELDVDISVPGLLRDVLGFAEPQQLRAARARTPKKAASSRTNGKKGGRPRKNAVAEIATNVVAGPV